MFIEQDYYIGYRSIGKDFLITNKALMTFLEDTGGIHSSLAGTGVLQIEKTHLSWVALHWILHVYNRPRYGDTIRVKTWSVDRSGAKDELLYADRDFEVYDKNNNVIARATSRWAMVNSETLKITKLFPEIMNPYKAEKQRTWNNIEFPKLKEPDRVDSISTYTIDKRLIDFNNHVHNTDYLDLVDFAVPDNVDSQLLNNVEIMYRKQIKLADNVKLKYSNINNEHIISITSEDDKILHSVIQLS